MHTYSSYSTGPSLLSQSGRLGVSVSRLPNEVEGI